MNYENGIFYAIFGGKMSVAATVAPKGLGLQDPTKKLAHWFNRYLKNQFSNILGLNPPSTTQQLQIMTGEEAVREAGKKFLLERIADSDRYFPTLQTDELLRSYLTDQVGDTSNNHVYN